jgi:hypothetical protein
MIILIFVNHSIYVLFLSTIRKDTQKRANKANITKQNVKRGVTSVLLTL